MNSNKVKIRTYTKRNSGEKKLIALVDEPDGCIQNLNFSNEEYSVKKIFLPVSTEKFSVIFENLSKTRDIGSALCRECTHKTMRKGKLLNCSDCKIRNGKFNQIPIDGIVYFTNASKGVRKIIFFYRYQTEEKLDQKDPNQDN